MVNATPDRRSEERVLAALADVMDPEMPGVSIVALGMVEAVRVAEGRVAVTLLPTFVGCPALHIMQRDAQRRIAAALDLPLTDVRVDFSLATPWTTARIAPTCFGALRERGIAPPPPDPDSAISRTERVLCPWCGSDDTRTEGLFGPTACRSLHYCRRCRNVFEAIKPV